MLKLNIKSKSYMCIDIDPDSVIHELLVKRITSTDSWINANEFDGCEYFESKILRIEEVEMQLYNWGDDHGHQLTQLPSFHISLGKPPEGVYPSVTELKLADDEQFYQLIGLITLADIQISRKDDKKSAWIEIGNPKDPRDRYPSWLVFCQTPAFPDLNVENYLRRKDGIPHISLANKTGNSHDSITRPENCTIDRIEYKTDNRPYHQS